MLIVIRNDMTYNFEFKDRNDFNHYYNICKNGCVMGRHSFASMLNESFCYGWDEYGHYYKDSICDLIDELYERVYDISRPTDIIVKAIIDAISPNGNYCRIDLNVMNEVQKTNPFDFVIGEAMHKEIKNMFICDGERALDEFFKKAKEEDTMMKPVTSIKVTDVKNYNDRAVLVYFNDGTFTKAVCSENDAFDLDVGIQVCMMKKIFGSSGYYKLMKDIHKRMEYNERVKEKEKALRKELRDKQKKREEKAAAKRQAHIEQYKEDIAQAVLLAIQINNENEKAREDDLK